MFVTFFLRETPTRPGSSVVEMSTDRRLESTSVSREFECQHDQRVFFILRK